jgi:tryptophanyl-tRNA synthetase
MKIKTNSLEPGEPKDPDDSALFAIYAAFASAGDVEAMRRRCADGIAWGEMKQLVFELIDAEIGPLRTEYERLIADPGHVETVLQAGAERARAISEPFLARIRSRVGVRPLA